MMHTFCLIYISLLCSLSAGITTINENNKFPCGFLFGTSTAAYQIEGAWNVSGKGENIWDRFTHEHPDQITDGSNGDVACDSYHKFREDVALMKQMGVQLYRFSLSWSRILPRGFSYQINPDGIRYYNDLINLLLENDITPMVTLLHYDTPQPLQDLGGFTSSLFAEWFEEYARVAFDNFGDRVKLWLTFNEPRQVCYQGYGGTAKAPAINATGIGDYICGHNLLKAHARAYHLYKNIYKPLQKGKVSIALDSPWFEPKTNSRQDSEAAERILAFAFRWFADPIFSKSGDYPRVMKDIIARRSELEGFPQSRLPKFTLQEIIYIRGTYDFLGLNHYTSFLVEDVKDDPIGTPSFDKDARIKLSTDPSWPPSASSWIFVVPWGFTKLLKWFKSTYGNIEIYITENGYSDNGELEDIKRINYIQEYLSALLDAIYDHRVNVKAYACWSLLDNYEWMYGYTAKFGLHHVDFNDPERTRTPKASATYYKNVIKNRGLIFN